jgi:transcriptional regulator with XRE-family HTH domain
MKITVGHKLYKIREDKKLSQLDMAELLCISAATYSRLERNETSIELEKMIHMAKKLDIPIQDLLPETLSFTNTTENGQGQFIFGNNYYYANPQIPSEILKELEDLRKEVAALRKKI